MGLIKKKTAVRATEGGIKYICDICSVDITATVCFQAHGPWSVLLIQADLTDSGQDTMRR